MAAIQVEGLVRCFGELRAVNGIDLEVSEGEIYGFLGPNGAGKSTLVRMLCTLLLPTSGRARVAGFDVVSQAAQLRFSIGAALQEAALDDRMTGLEILQTQGRLFGLRSSEISRRIDELARSQAIAWKESIHDHDNHTAPSHRGAADRILQRRRQHRHPVGATAAP